MTPKTIAVALALCTLAVAHPAIAGDTAPVTISRPAALPAGCFTDHARVPRASLPRLPEASTLRFTVDAQGGISGVRLDRAGDRILVAHLRSALERCTWAPGADPRGVPVAAAVMMPVRFVP